MRVIFKGNAGDTLRALFKKHFDNKETIGAETCLFVARLPELIKGVDGQLLSTQKTLLCLQSKFALGKGPRVSPLTLSHVPSEELTEADSINCLRDIVYEHRIASNNMSHKAIFNKLIKLETVEDVTHALAFFYVFTTLGTKENHKEWVDPPAN